ncbi:hypothetical protein J1N35_028672 [Gossypium stocksii]|uniref:Uncharacterized protein n=1 Tax=Gossypium stocksii TaxID=47602 RepID=A0A9D3ZST3_9ROSI|nr:hypothetical protein J1N35_028672 [Gossypium stocksii]
MDMQKKIEEDSYSKTGSMVRTRPEIHSKGREIVKSGELLDINIENRKNINVYRSMMERANKEAELVSVFKVIKLGKADVVDNVRVGRWRK